MIKTKIIDNWLGEDLVDYLNHHFLFNLPHFYGHKSNYDDKSSFYVTPLNIDDALNKFLFYKLEKTLDKNLNLNKMYLNIQHQNMDGSFHVDTSTDNNVYMTCIYMVTNTLKDGGAFEIKNEDIIPFVQNRLIIFDANKLHRGLSPNKNEVRITLAFKIKE